MKFCSKCGGKLEPDDKFCQKCGFKTKFMKETKNILESKKDKNLMGLPKRVSKKTAWIVFIVMGILIVIMVYSVLNHYDIKGKSVTKKQFYDYQNCYDNDCPGQYNSCSTNCYELHIGEPSGNCIIQCKNAENVCLRQCDRII